MFKPADAKAAADGTENGAVSRQVADSVIGQVLKALGGKVTGILFQVVETPGSLQEDIRADAAAQKVRNPRGVYHEGVQVVRSPHKSAQGR